MVRRRASNAEATEAFGAELARSLPTGDELLVIYLSGDLGAGKTTLARGFLRECGIRGPVRSPTYTLVEAYQSASRTFLHLDLYRLREASELENLGLRDWATAGHVWLIEWPERGAERLPPPDLVVTLTAGESQHDIEVTGRTPAGASWLAALEAVEKRSSAP